MGLTRPGETIGGGNPADAVVPLSDRGKNLLLAPERGIPVDEALLNWLTAIEPLLNALDWPHLSSLQVGGVLKPELAISLYDVLSLSNLTPAQSWRHMQLVEESSLVETFDVMTKDRLHTLWKNVFRFFQAYLLESAYPGGLGQLIADQAKIIVSRGFNESNRNFSEFHSLL